MISFNCPGCQASYTVSDERAGKQGKCPKCQTPFTVPPPTATAPPVREPEPEPEVERPRKRATRREEVEDDEDRPRAKRRPREDDDAEDDRPRKESKPRPAMSPLDRALGTIRRGQFLDLAAVFTLLLAGGVLALVLTTTADSWQEARIDEWKMASAKYHDDVSASMNSRGGIPFPNVPAVLSNGRPDSKYAARDMLSQRGWLYLLFTIPAGMIAVGSILSAVGRFRMASVAAGSGGGRGFAAVGVLALGRCLLGLAAVAGCVWAMTQAGAETDFKRVPELVGASVGGLVFSLYVGVIGEVFALPALALAGWFHRTTDTQRHRIGTAAAFYPVVVIGWFVLSLAFAALAVFVPDTRVIAGGVEGVLFLVIQVVQYIVLSRAYRFPPAAVIGEK
jgi:predicted Zn finger-like uncharacterized protein